MRSQAQPAVGTASGPWTDRRTDRRNPIRLSGDSGPGMYEADGDRYVEFALRAFVCVVERGARESGPHCNAESGQSDVLVAAAS